jgi:hypothetical protein
MRRLTLFLAPLLLSAAGPAKPQLQDVSVLFGPGYMPRDGEAQEPSPFQPKLSGTLRVAGTRAPGIFSFWLVPKGAARQADADALERAGGRLLPPAPGEWTRRDGAWVLAFEVPWPAGAEAGSQDLVVLVGRGRYRVLGESPIEVHNLPASRPDPARTPERN